MSSATGLPGESAPGSSHTTIRIDDAGPHDPQMVRLVVMAGATIWSRELASSERCVAGRAAECEIRIDEPTLSRRHATFVCESDGEVFVEDLESANGTFLEGRRLGPGERARVRIGVPVRLGQAIVMLQRAGRPFSAQLVDGATVTEQWRASCARAPEGGAQIALVHVCSSAPLATAAVEQLAHECLRGSDIVGTPSATEIVVVLAAASRDELEPICAQLLARCRSHVTCAAATRLFPRDGDDPVRLAQDAAKQARVALAATAQGDMLLRDPAMIALYERAMQVARGRLSVLVTGETGVGKEHLAEAIHRHGAHPDQPFIRVNCAAMSESLFESELFGHERGAFTGAVGAKQGLIEVAGEGTLFLDEIGELPLALQGKLLRALEEGKVMRVGGTTPRPVRARFVAATNRDLEAEVARGAFRKDLYYRLAGITLSIPPLRARRAEILPLAEIFLATAARDLGRPETMVLSREAQDALCNHDWPGNVRELRNVIGRAVLLAPSATVDADSLLLPASADARPSAPTVPPPVEERASSPPPDAAGADTEAAPSDGERERILDALARSGGNQKEAAKLLGIARRTLGKRLERYNITRPRKR